MTCARCRALYRADPGRPDCDSPNPQYDGKCPRRGHKIDPAIAKFLFLVGLFMEYGAAPVAGGLYDQDVRFITTLVVVGSDAKVKEIKSLEGMLKKMRM